MPRPGSLAAALLIVCACGSALAQGGSGASVEVEVDRRSMSVDEVLQVTFTVSGAYDDLREPRFSAFEVVGRRHAEQMSFSNGQLSRSKSLVFQLQPKTSGELQIGAMQALRGGQLVAQSPPVIVTVREARTLPPPTADGLPGLDSQADQSIFLQTQMSRRSYYVGEVFPITWQLYFRPDVAVQSLETVASPKLPGLLAEELLARDRQPRPKEKTIRGRRFRYFPQSVQLLTGLQAGQTTVDAMTVRVSVGQFFAQKRYTVRSQAFKLDIRPLPAEGRPATFRDGNVGRFAVSGTLHNADGAVPRQVQTGERLILGIEISGEGNLVSVKPPVIDAGEDFEVQPLSSSAEDIIEKDTRGMHGKRVFQYLVSPRKPGELVTPEVAFSYFDPASGRYETLTVPGTEITVAGRAIVDGATAAVLSGDDIGPHVDGHTLTSTPRTRLVGSPLFWLLVLVPLGGYLAVEVRHRIGLAHARDPGKRRARGALGNARKRLQLANRVLEEGLVKDFYGHISRALTAYFEERANLPAVGMTHDELREAMLARGYLSDDVDAAIVELENCDFARFAPAASAQRQMRETLDRVAGIVDRLDRVEPGKPS